MEAIVEQQRYEIILVYDSTIVEDIKQYQKRWVNHLERMDRSRLPVPTSGMAG
jgi:GTPase SAR1 family protein